MPVDEIMVDTPPGSRTVVSFDHAELTVILFEGLTSQRRPPGITIAQAIAEIETASPETYEACKRTAYLVLEYVSNQFKAPELERLQ